MTLDAIAAVAARQWSDAYIEFVRATAFDPSGRCVLGFINHPIFRGRILLDLGAVAPVAVTYVG